MLVYPPSPLLSTSKIRGNAFLLVKPHPHPTPLNPTLLWLGHYGIKLYKCLQELNTIYRYNYQFVSVRFEFQCYSRFFTSIIIWRSHHYRWMAANFDLYKAHMASEQGGFLNMPQPLRHWLTVYIGHLRDPWHSHPIPSVWHWSCHYLFYLFLRLKSVVGGIRIPNLLLAGRTLLSLWQRSTPAAVNHQ